MRQNRGIRGILENGFKSRYAYTYYELFPLNSLEGVNFKI